MMELSQTQNEVLKKLVDGIKKTPIQTLAGFAGTGKTTLAAEFLRIVPGFGACAYTGKASAILRKKGIPANTIHSTIYEPSIDHNGNLQFVLREHLPYQGLLADEGSMIPLEIYEDLRFFGIPLIFVGDHGQLEPIGSDFNLMKRPDYRLEEIHRFAGDIAKFAQHLRKGFAARGFRGTTGEVQLLSQIKDDDLIWADQIICAYNKTRVDLNNRVRAILGYKGILNVGERVMCLRNNRKLGLYNGMQGIVRRLHKSRRKFLMDFEYDNILYPNIWYNPNQFGQEKNEFDYGDGPNPFDYAYTGTAHKMQGDEFEKVLAIEQRCTKWDMRRWNYTVASRARTFLSWALA
jgi:exodeoxyribonuclease V